jgi:hypothetical protein
MISLKARLNLLKKKTLVKLNKMVYNMINMLYNGHINSTGVYYGII